MPAYINTFPTASIQLATTPGTDLYACPSGTRAQIRKLSFLNTTGTQRLVTVHIARAGAVNAANNQIWNAVPVPITTTAPRGIECFEAEGQVLNPGDVLRAFTDAVTGASITGMGSVVEYS